MLNKTITSPIQNNSNIKFHDIKQPSRQPSVQTIKLWKEFLWFNGNVITYFKPEISNQKREKTKQYITLKLKY